MHGLDLLMFIDIVVFDDETALENAKLAILELLELKVFFVLSNPWCGQIRNFCSKSFSSILPKLQGLFYALLALHYWILPLQIF